jgi:hypothetical protein
MKNLFLGFLLFGSASSFAGEINDRTQIESILTRYPELINQILAKSITNGKLIQANKIVSESSGNVWDEDGASFDCKIKLTAFSDTLLVGQITRIYTDRDCPQL